MYCMNCMWSCALRQTNVHDSRPCSNQQKTFPWDVGISIGSYTHSTTFSSVFSCFVIHLCSLLCCVYQRGDTPLMEACRGGHLPVVQMLLDEKANVNIKSNVSWLLIAIPYVIFAQLSVTRLVLFCYSLVLFTLLCLSVWYHTTYGIM